MIYRKEIIILVLLIFFAVPLSGKAAERVNEGANKVYSSGFFHFNINVGGKAYVDKRIDGAWGSVPSYVNAVGSEQTIRLSIMNGENNRGSLNVDPQVKTLKASVTQPLDFDAPNYELIGNSNYTEDQHVYTKFKVYFTLPEGYKYGSYSREREGDIALAARVDKSLYFPAANNRASSIQIIANTGIFPLRTVAGYKYTGNRLTIEFIPNSTEVRYNANGGKGKMVSHDIIYGNSAKLAKNKFSRSGYIFAGWNTQKNGSGRKYSDVQNVGKEFPSQSNIELYAQWKKKEVERVELNKEIIVGKKGERKKVNAVIFPSDALDRKLTYKSSKKKIATVDNKGNIKFKRVGKTIVTVTTENGKKAKCEVFVSGTVRRGWRKETNADMENNGCNIMEGMAGVGNRIYFIKIINHGSLANKRATLYRADISGKRVTNIRVLGRFTNLHHANAMTAIGTKNNTDLYIAPGGKAKGYVLKVKIVNGKVKKQDGNKVNKVYLKGKRLDSFSVSGISHFYQNGRLYFILKKGITSWITEPSGHKKLIAKSTFFINAKRDYIGILPQGTTCEFDSRGYYYVPFSYAKSLKRNSRQKKEDGNKALSIIEVYRLNISDNCKSVDSKYVRTIELRAGKRIGSKRGGYYPKFEIEDVYVHKNRIYFNSEGGVAYRDIIGSMKLR